MDWCETQVIIRNKSVLGLFRFQMKRRLTIHGHSRRVSTRGGHRRSRCPCEDARQSRHGMTVPPAASIGRAPAAAETAAAARSGTARTRPERTFQRVDAAAGTTHSDNRVQIGTLSRNFRDRLACVRAPHWDLPDPVPRTPVRAGCRHLVPERDRRDRRPHARSGAAGARVSPGPAGEPYAARNRGHRAARPTLRRRLSC